ncbi:DUF4229 domain-containing protein [Sporichthya sp.]|uniref:DUF4229 domain-containing protein n=1 Tax=Sporichthya sp. TaxID=65475 RepID=UPI00181A05E4|nr:DUF4229 domain-containing protein [Sporichthya sp.]MBA3744730.1 DUF4229 domain-containing protein [Sporichthya sp.]
MPPTVSYSVRRLALFAATLALLTALLRGTPFVAVLLIATLVSGVLSYFLLAGSRERMAQVVAGRVSRLNDRLDLGAAAEDAALDAAELPEKGVSKPE